MLLFALKGGAHLVSLFLLSFAWIKTTVVCHAVEALKMHGIVREIAMGGDSSSYWRIRLSPHLPEQKIYDIFGTDVGNGAYTQFVCGWSKRKCLVKLNIAFSLGVCRVFVFQELLIEMWGLPTRVYEKAG